MRLLELEIHNVRGIKELLLSPKGANLVVWGPNGSGKSAVVDAVDFLLTGRISRLMGEGTAGISLKAHGPHIDHKPQEASVTAKIKIAGLKVPMPLSRSMATPSNLIYPPEHEHLIKPLLEIASRGQHVLSRREILKYVAAEAGKRSSEVQALLNLTELEEIRKGLGRVVNAAKTEYTTADGAARTSRAVVQTTLGLGTFDLGVILAAVNKLRECLGGRPLATIDSGNLKKDLAAPSTGAKPGTINPQALARVQLAVSMTLDDLQKTVAEPDDELRKLLEELRKDEIALREISKLRLMDLGLSHIPEDGSCPLCGTQWKPGDLRKHLESHIASAKVASERSATIRALAESISAVADGLQISLDQLAIAATQLGLESEAGKLTEWSASLVEVSQSLNDPLGKYPGAAHAPDDVARLFAPDQGKGICGKIVNEAEQRVPPVSPEQTAWDTLTRLGENWSQYEKTEARYQSSQTVHERAKTLEKCFEEARERVLSSLYEEIEARFSELYRFIHKEDEPKFESSLRPDGASLVFEVDFYGRGKFPPLALHSEGHQDTMGLCLYLALAERLTQGIIELTILDDVVMSVDAAHRRKVCELLASQFPNRQFLITTHDRTWARQLTTTAVVPRQNAIEFTRWSVDTGPLVAMEAEEPTFWSKIHQEIDAGDVPSAAARLRRGAEQFFEQVCDNLQANVRYRSDGRWELSDFSGGGIGTYRKRLKEAKAAANSWGDSAKVATLEEAESVVHQVIQRSQVEQWAINENVHYSRWRDYQPDDFRPVCEAWRDLLGLFQCSSCGGMLFLAEKDKRAASICCQCGKVHLNLIKKETKPAHATTISGTL